MSLSYTRKSEGTLSVTGPYGELREIKTSMCGHCGRILLMPIGNDGLGKLAVGKYIDAFLVPRKDEVHVCHQCFTTVCDQCHAVGYCKPMLERLTEIEKREAALKSYGV